MAKPKISTGAAAVDRKTKVIKTTVNTVYPGQK